MVRRCGQQELFLPHLPTCADIRHLPLPSRRPPSGGFRLVLRTEPPLAPALADLGASVPAAARHVIDPAGLRDVALDPASAGANNCWSLRSEPLAPTPIPGLDELAGPQPATSLPSLGLLVRIPTVAIVGVFQRPALADGRVHRRDAASSRTPLRSERTPTSAHLRSHVSSEPAASSPGSAVPACHLIPAPSVCEVQLKEVAAEEHEHDAGAAEEHAQRDGSGRDRGV